MELYTLLFYETLAFLIEPTFLLKVFSICANDGSEKASSEDLIKFLEAVAELEGEDDAVDSDAAKFVTNKIMEFRENKSDKEEITKEEITKEGITKDEFLAW
jgi:hypothetical protein